MKATVWELRSIETKRRERQNGLDDIMIGRRPIKPIVLLSPEWDRYENAARLFFNALLDKHAECAASGRLNKWRAAALSGVELFSSPPYGIEFVKRDEIESPAVAGPASDEVLDADQEREPLTPESVPIFDLIRKVT